MSTAAKVGAFFLIVLAITGLLIWKIEDLRIGRGRPRKVTVQFQNVAGLDEKTAFGLPASASARSRRSAWWREKPWSTSTSTPTSL